MEKIRITHVGEDYVEVSYVENGRKDHDDITEPAAIKIIKSLIKDLKEAKKLNK